jgi:hypothetical protein
VLGATIDLTSFFDYLSFKVLPAELGEAVDGAVLDANDRIMLDFVSVEWPSVQLEGSKYALLYFIYGAVGVHACQ